MPRINSYDPKYNSKMLFAEETEKTEQEQLYHLVELVLPEPESKLKIVDANYDVVYGWMGNEENKGTYTYSKFPLKYSPPEVNSDGSISRTNITIANVSREIMYYVEQYNGLRGCRVSVKAVYANVLYYKYVFEADGTVTEIVNPGHNPDAHLHDEFFIDNYTANEQTVTFQLEPIIDLEIRLPRRRYMVDSCPFIFRDLDTCGYQGDAVSCTKTLAACKERGNQRYFGGFPGISGSRRIFL